MLRISPSPSSTPHPAHTLNTALIHVQIDDTEHLHRQITIDLFLGKKIRFILQLPNPRKVKWKWFEWRIVQHVQKAAVYWRFVRYFWRSLLKKNRIAVSRIGLVYTNTAEHNTLTSLLELSVSFHKFYRATYCQHQLHFRVQLEATFIVTYLFWEHK